MTSRDSDELVTLQGRIAELRETQRWVHDAVDLSNGRVLSTELDHPGGALSRANRLSALGVNFSSGIFGAPWYVLTPRDAYQASPQAYYYASSVSTYDPYDDEIIFNLPRQFPDTFTRGMRFLFDQSPDRTSVLSVSIEAWSYTGMTGHVSIMPAWSPITAQISISGIYSAHTVDCVFIPMAGRMSDITMRFEEGIQTLIFKRVTFGPTPPILEAVMS